MNINKILAVVWSAISGVFLIIAMTDPTPGSDIDMTMRYGLMWSMAAFLVYIVIYAGYTITKKIIKAQQQDID